MNGDQIGSNESAVETQFKLDQLEKYLNGLELNQLSSTCQLLQKEYKTKYNKEVVKNEITTNEKDIKFKETEKYFKNGAFLQQK